MAKLGRGPDKRFLGLERLPGPLSDPFTRLMENAGVKSSWPVSLWLVSMVRASLMARSLVCVAEFLADAQCGPDLCADIVTVAYQGI